MEIKDFLKLVEPFQGLSDSRVRALAEQCVVKKYLAGERIISRGEPGDSMYVVRRGKVRVVVKDEEGQERFVTILAVGECFGEMALLTGEPRSADVAAETDCECLVIQKGPLDEFLRENPSVAAFLTEILGKRLLEAGHLQSVGKYRLLGELGRGGIAIVYEAIHPDLQRTVAIKMLSHALVYDQEFATRFKNEAMIIAGLEHENIVRVFDCEEAYATYFIIMEKISGIDLTRKRESKGSLDEAETRDIIMQLSSALDYAHRHGIIHRDIKPDNVIVDDRGHVKLMDFGIAKTRSEEENNEDIIGTAEYMAPEQALGKRIDGRADIYSLGIMAYELLTGKLPFDSHDPYEILRKHLNDRMPPLRDLRPDASDEMAEFIERACRKDPEQRFRDGAAIIHHFGGPEDETRKPLGVVNVSLFFDPSHVDSIDALVEQVKSSASRIPSVKVRVSDLGEV